MAWWAKNLPANAGDKGDKSLTLGSGRFPGEGNGNPLQYSCLEESHGPRRHENTAVQTKSLESEESNSCLFYPLALEQITVSSCVIFHLSHRIVVRIK